MTHLYKSSDGHLKKHQGGHLGGKFYPALVDLTWSGKMVLEYTFPDPEEQPDEQYDHFDSGAITMSDISGFPVRLRGYETNTNPYLVPDDRVDLILATAGAYSGRYIVSFQPGASGNEIAQYVGPGVGEPEGTYNTLVFSSYSKTITNTLSNITVTLA